MILIPMIWSSSISSFPNGLLLVKEIMKVILNCWWCCWSWWGLGDKMEDDECILRKCRVYSLSRSLWSIVGIISFFVWVEKLGMMMKMKILVWVAVLKIQMSGWWRSWCLFLMIMILGFGWNRYEVLENEHYSHDEMMNLSSSLWRNAPYLPNPTVILR